VLRRSGVRLAKTSPFVISSPSFTFKSVERVRVRRIMKRSVWASGTAGAVWAVVKNVLGEMEAGRKTVNVVSPAMPKIRGFIAWC
jgi:hypothetical protein